MYILQRDNVVKIAETDTQRDLLKSKGFVIPGETEIELQSAVLGFAKENEELRKHIGNQDAENEELKKHIKNQDSEIETLKKLLEESKSKVPENPTSDIPPSDPTVSESDASGKTKK